MSANREMAAYARQPSEDGNGEVTVAVRKEENMLAFLRYVFSWFRRKGTVQEPPSACCTVVRYCHRLMHTFHAADVPLFQQRLKGYQPLMTLTVAAATFGVVVSQHGNKNILFFMARNLYFRIAPESKRSTDL